MTLCQAGTHERCERTCELLNHPGESINNIDKDCLNDIMHTEDRCRKCSTALLSINDDGEAVFSQRTTLRDGDTLMIPELFPGWEISITNLWPAVYEEQ